MNMPINHGYAAEHGSYDAEISLIGPGQEQVPISYQTILELAGMTIDRPFQFGRKPLYCKGRKRVFVYNVISEIASDFLNGFD